LVLFVCFASYEVAVAQSVAKKQQVASSQSNVTPASTASTASTKIFAQVYGSWIYRCAVTSQPNAVPKKFCAVEQQMVLNQGGKTIPLMTLAVVSVKSPGVSHITNIVAPLDVLLGPGIAISVDAVKPQVMPFTFCNTQGCWVVGSPVDAFLHEAHGAKLGHAEVAMLNGRKLTINFSLNGFAPALAALDSGVVPSHEIQSKG